MNAERTGPVGLEALEALRPEAERLISQYEQRRAATLPVLHLIQERHGAISREAELWTSELMGVSPAHIREVVSFYTLFHRQAVGRYHLQVCMNLSCALRGAEDVLAHLQERLGIKAGETTPDGRFTLSTVECLCACEQAPMLQVNGRYTGPLTQERIDQLLSECREAGGG